MGTIQYSDSQTTAAAPTAGRRLRRATAAAAARLSDPLRPAHGGGGFARRAPAVTEFLEARQLLSRAPIGPVVTPTLDPATGVSVNNLAYYGTRKSDRIIVSRNAADAVVVSLNGVDQAIPEPIAGTITVYGGGGHDKVAVGGTREHPVGPVTFYGGSGNDELSGGDGADVLYGEKGHDVLAGGDGADTLDGGAGNDKLSGGGGTDALTGGSGKNVFSADFGEVTDAATSKKNVLSPTANAPVQTDAAKPLAFFGTRTGLSPTEIRTQYGFGNLADPSFTTRGNGQAIAVVIPYDVTNVRLSVNTFSQSFGLPQVDAQNLQIINSTGASSPADPDPFHGWEAEATLNLSWAHAIAPAAQLYLVLADSDLFTDLFIGVDKAVDTLVSRHGGGTVLMSWGSQNGELNPNLEAYLDQSFTRKASRTVTFVTGSGDVGGVTSYPSVSPYVVSVGGTSLERDTAGNLTGRETAWSLGGGGASATYPSPGYQRAITVNGAFPTTRVTPDVALSADPISGYALYVATGFGDVDGDGTNDSGWLPGGAGGTSAAASVFAGFVSLANQARSEADRGFLGINFNDAIYDLDSVYTGAYFNDITIGTAGTLPATAGYDLATGLGSLRANLLLTRLASAGTVPIGDNNLEWFGEFKEAITRTGPLSSPAGGFIRGTGSVAGNNGLTLTLTPRYDLTPQAPSFPTNSNTTGTTNIQPGQIQVTNLSIANLVRNADNTVVGFGTADVTILLTPLQIPVSGIGGNTTTPSPPASPPGTVPPPPPGTGGNPDPVPIFNNATFDESQPVLVPELRTWSFTLRYTGRVVRDKKGHEHIVGTFVNAGRGDFDPQEGDRPYFKGEFESH